MAPESVKPQEAGAAEGGALLQGQFHCPSERIRKFDYRT